MLTAVIGMASVAWYALGGHMTEEEMEQEAREKFAAKANRGRFFGLFPKRS